MGRPRRRHQVPKGGRMGDLDDEILDAMGKKRFFSSRKKWKVLMYGGCAVGVAKWGPEAWRRAQRLVAPTLEAMLDFPAMQSQEWDYEVFGEPSPDVLAAREAAAFKTLEAVARARAQQRKSREDPTARHLEALVRAGRLEDALAVAQESLDAVEKALSGEQHVHHPLQQQQEDGDASSSSSSFNDFDESDDAESATSAASSASSAPTSSSVRRGPLSASERAKLFASAGDVHYWKGVALMSFPSRRCAGGTCRQHAAASFADCVKFGGARAAEAQVYLVEATTDLRGIDGTRPERVRALFDEYSATFEDHLVKSLRYEAPTILARAVARLYSSSSSSPTKNKLNVTLDVGCGTGLVARELRALDASAYVYGFDLSPEMIARASADRGLYDATAVCDARRLAACARDTTAGAFGGPHPHAPDLVVLADVLCYLDDVDAALVLEQTAKLQAKAVALTVERPNVDTEHILAKHKANDWHCILGSTGRYAHNLDWLVRVMADLHFDLKWIAELCDGPDCQYPPLRYERGNAVRGAIVIFQRTQRN